MTYFAALEHLPCGGVYYENDLAPLLRRAEQLSCEIADFDPATVADVVYLFGREKADRTYGSFHLRSGAPESIDSSTTIQGDGTVPVYSAQNFLVSSTRQTAEVQADHTSIINSATVLRLVDELYAKAIWRADLQTARANTQFASLLIAETAASGNLIPVSLDPEAWAQGDDKFAVQINTKALTAMGYKTTDVAQIASTKLDADERAKLYAVAASSTFEPSQRLTLIGDVALTSYAAGRFEDAIRSSAYVAAVVERAPSSDPKTVNLQKAVKEVEGWSYLRGGDLGKFSDLASSYATKYAVTKEEFREPRALPSELQIVDDVGGVLVGKTRDLIDPIILAPGSSRAVVPLHEISTCLVGQQTTSALLAHRTMQTCCLPVTETREFLAPDILNRCGRAFPAPSGIAHSTCGAIAEGPPSLGPR